MPEFKKYARVCISRCGYAVVGGNTDAEIMENTKKLRENDFDWESVNDDVLGDATIIEECNAYGEPLDDSECAKEEHA